MDQLNSAKDELNLVGLISKVKTLNTVMPFCKFDIVIAKVLDNVSRHAGRSDVSIEAGIDQKGCYVITVRDHGEKGLSLLDNEKIFEVDARLSHESGKIMKEKGKADRF